MYGCREYFSGKMHAIKQNISNCHNNVVLKLFHSYLAGFLLNPGFSRNVYTVIKFESVF